MIDYIQLQALAHAINRMLACDEKQLDARYNEAVDALQDVRDLRHSDATIGATIYVLDVVHAAVSR